MIKIEEKISFLSERDLLGDDNLNSHGLIWTEIMQNKVPMPTNNNQEECLRQKQTVCGPEPGVAGKTDESESVEYTAQNCHRLKYLINSYEIPSTFTSSKQPMSSSLITIPLLPQ